MPHNLFSTRTVVGSVMFIFFTFFAPSIGKAIAGNPLATKDFQDIGEGLIGIVTIITTLHADDKTAFTPNGLPGRNKSAAAIVKREDNGEF